MILIDDLKDNTITLTRNESNIFEQELTITSQNENGSTIPFSIEFVSSNYITVSTYGNYGIKIIADTPNILQNEYIILRNAENERVRITIKPNSYFTMERNYKFKITSEKIDKDGKLILKILSKVNNMDIGWQCTYMGQPISYDVSPLNSDKGEYVTISNKKGNVIYGNFDSLFKFQQNESNNIIKYYLHNTPNGIIVNKKGNTK